MAISTAKKYRKIESDLIELAEENGYKFEKLRISTGPIFILHDTRYDMSAIYEPFYDKWKFGISDTLQSSNDFIEINQEAYDKLREVAGKLHDYSNE